MIIKHTESISFELKTEWRQAVDFGTEHRDWVKTDGTDTVTYTKENVWMYDLSGERKESKVKKCFDIPKEVAERLLEDTERKETE